MVVGEDGLGLQFDDVELARNVGTAALAVILVEGGLTTRFSDIRDVLAPASALATLGVVSAPRSPRWGPSVPAYRLAAGPAVGSDRLLHRRGSGVLRAARAAVAAASGGTARSRVRLQRCARGDSGAGIQRRSVRVRAGGGGGQPGLRVGLRLGDRIGRRIPRQCRAAPCRVAGIRVVPHRDLRQGIVAFAAAGSVHASGFIAAYLAAVVLGNSGMHHRSATRSFAEGLGWLAQIGLFVLLGLLVDPSELRHDVAPAVVIGLVLLLVARPCR